MMQSRTLIPTPKAQGYLQQLCKHFGHKLPVEVTPEAGAITFPMGTCRLTADAATLTMEVEAEEAAIARMEEVMASHLLRFAFREDLMIEWQRG